MRRIIVDTGIWYACFDRTDAHHRYSGKILDMLRVNDIIIPFPTLYETVNTRFVKNAYGQMQGFSAYLHDTSKVHLVDDARYRERARDIVFGNAGRGKPYSLVDTVIRLMMEDVSLGAIAVMTFNVGDFMGVNNTEIIDPRTA